MTPLARMPALFIGHGSPMNALERNRYTEAWRALGASLPRPKAVLCVSAHWLTRGLAVTAMPRPRTIHDFGGFPQALFDVQYPAAGDVRMAQRVCEVLQPLPVALDTEWGLDHGAWSVLVHLFPDADVPVLQLSL
ncbi:MAG: class III extradiol ring-cleavage dioxygenase, partial [Pseudomonadota bacterium]